MYRGYPCQGAYWVIRRVIQSIPDARDSPAVDLPSSAETSSSAASYTTIHQYKTLGLGFLIRLHFHLSFNSFERG